ncbi:MAG: hypothetical protein Hens2KO_02520 [Henriciella sp.]
MVDILPAYAFQGIIFLAAIFGIAALLLLPQTQFDGLDFKLLFRTEGTLPDWRLRLAALIVLALIMVLSGLFWIIVYKLTADVRARTPLVSLAPVVSIVSQPKSPLEKAIEYYTDTSPDLNFGNLVTFEGEDGRNVTMLSKDAQDKSGLWFIDAVLIYETGDSVRFRPAVLYGDESWKYQSWTHIKRRGFSREVKIETALKRHGALRDQALRYDHLITLGLASRQSDNYDEDFNYALAWARGQNLAVAVHNLKWKPVERIWPLHLGYAKVVSEAPHQQRPAVIIGVRASQEIIGADVLVGTHLLIKVDGVQLNQYSIPLTSIWQPKPIKPELGYRTPQDPKFGAVATRPFVLPGEDNAGADMEE